MKRYEMTKENWEQIKPLLPPEITGKRGRPRKDNRTMLNGMLWIVRSGAQWRELPEAYGPWQSVYARWRDDGTLEKVFRALCADADMENLSIDSTCIKVHESANGGGGGGETADKAVGRTMGGLNTKLHAIVDGLGNPVTFLLSAGNDHDYVHAIEVLDKLEISGSNVLADRAYGAKAIRDYISEHGAGYVIPPQSNIAEPWPVDWHLYKERC